MSLGPTYTCLPGQLYILFSCVGPECPQRTDKFGIKFYGAFPTVEAAKAHAQKLQKEDATFDILVADANQWLLIPPDKRMIEDTHYVEEKLEEIMQERKKNAQLAASLFEKRKRDMMAKPLEGSDTPYIDPADEYSKYYTKPDEPPVHHPSDYLEELRKEFPKASDVTIAKIADLKVVAEIECRKAERVVVPDLPEEPENPEGDRPVPELLE